MQFEILGKLRNIQNLIIKEEQDMALVDIYDMETDVRFMQGEERGIQKTHNAVITNMLLTSKFAVEEIAKLVNVSTDFVLNIQNTLIAPASSPTQ